MLPAAEDGKTRRLVTVSSKGSDLATVCLYEANPHYLEFRGRPVVLITSAEHYGAVLNLDFDMVRYLDALAADGMNLTRTFAGTYFETPGSFGIVGNTLAPSPGRLACPWVRGTEPGGPAGGAKLDLSRWDEAFFARLKEFIAQADRRGIIVELTFFCFLYSDELWAASPMNPAHHEAPAGVADSWRRIFSLDGNPLLGHQERLVRKLVTDLNGFDNIYYEVINEPYSLHDGTAFVDWQNRMIDVMVETERALPKRHLIARNVHNRTMVVGDLHPAVGIVNFHYAEPSAVAWNYHLHRVLADDETGFRGQTCQPYRTEAWKFMLSGGGVFNHLDYSFTAAKPDGTAAIEGESPSFGGPELRAQLRVLKDFMDRLPLATIAPHPEVFNTFGSLTSPETNIAILADPGRVYAAYICSPGPRERLVLGIPAGRYRSDWLRPTDGRLVRSEVHDHDGGSLVLVTPTFSEDLALHLAAE